MPQTSKRGNGSKQNRRGWRRFLAFHLGTHEPDQCRSGTIEFRPGRTGDTMTGDLSNAYPKEFEHTWPSLSPMMQ